VNFDFQPRTMDVDVEALPYDDEAGDKYAHEHPEHDFKNRIGSGRLYLFAESSAKGLRVRSSLSTMEYCQHLAIITLWFLAITKP
jgi:hypothetical protein